MGLYDRDYMRAPVSDELESSTGRRRLQSRRHLLIAIGLALLAAALIAMMV